MIYKTLQDYLERSKGQINLSNAKLGVPPAALALLALWMYSSKKSSKKTNKIMNLIKQITSVPPIDDDHRKSPVAFDGTFFARFLYIIKTCYPSIWCRDMAVLVTLTAALFARTGLTILISNRMAHAVSFLCKLDWGNATRNMLIFQSIGLLAAVVNGGLKYLTSMLGAGLRERLTATAHKRYLQNMQYYKSNFVGANVLEHTDQLIHEDIEKLTSCASDIYANVLKPIVDLLLFTIKLANTMEVLGPLGIYSWFGVASFISAMVIPPYGKLAAIKQAKEGLFRDREKRIINNAEMIAFMGGEEPEENLLNTAFYSIYDHTIGVARRKLFADIVMGFINKYSASCVGFTLLCLPFKYGWRSPNTPAHEIASYYVKCGQLMEGLADAILRLFDVQKQLGELSGLTARVHTLFYTLNHPEKLPLPISEEYPPQVIDGDHLAFNNVTVYKPDGRLLVKNLTFDVPVGRKIIITGENGCGKSSLFRVLKGLWPLCEGTITFPNRPNAFYFLSQVNFVPIGTLRDIITYPHGEKERKEKGVTDADLWNLLKDTRLEDLEYNDVKPTLNTIWDWNMALSPGQKQRMAFARLLYHSPMYAVLDECTNGVAPDVEVELYRLCESRKITVFSISHKLELKSLHDYELHYVADGLGGYEFIDLSEK